jgi:hypothetical protein
MPDTAWKFPVSVFDSKYARLCRSDASAYIFSAKAMALNRADALLIVS